MGASANIEFRKDEVYIRITVNRKHKRVKVAPVQESFWDKKNKQVKRSHPEYRSINNKINTKLSKYRSKIYDLEATDDDFGFEDILESAKEVRLYDAIVSYQRLISSQGKIKSERKYKNLADKVAEFSNPKLRSVDRGYLDKFQSYLLSVPKIKSNATVRRYIRDLGTVLRHNGILIPFKSVAGNGKSKAKLTRDEYDRFTKVNIAEYELSRDFFMSLINSWGCRVADMIIMQPKHIEGDILRYKETKTQKIKEVKITSTLMDIFNKYNGTSPYYIFPLMSLPPSDPRQDMVYSKKIESVTAIINRDLKILAAHAGIEKNLTTHVSRHTLAYWAAVDGLSIKKIKEMLNHAKVSTTELYLKELMQDEDLGQAVNDMIRGCN